MKKIFFCTLLFFSSLTFLFSQESKKIDLIQEASLKGMTLYYEPLSQSGIIEKNSHQIAFRVGDDFMLGDCSQIFMTDAPLVADGNLLVSEKFISQAESFFASEAADNIYKIGAILIDPGHGGKDPGALATHTLNGKTFTVKEKDINLKVAKMLYSMLKTAYPDKKILMTRDTDVFISLSGRTEIANAVKLADNEAILYISVHVNASLDKKSTGYEVWYLSPNYRRQVTDTDTGDTNVNKIINSMMEEEYTTESVLIAKFMLDAIAAQVGNLSTSRGIKAEEWFVVKNSKMPAVLVEVGFLTNAKEAALLADDSYLKKMAVGMYNGLNAFVTHFERSRGFTGTK